MIGLLIIGDEILSAQIQEKNLKYMLRNLAISGYKVSEARIIGDDKALIAKTVYDMSATYQYVITSGGVGPTHDDITLESIALAFRCSLQTNTKLESILKHYFKDHITDEILSMARLPDSAEAIFKNDAEWPIIKMKNCFILPGVPQVFQKKFDHVLQLLPRVEKYYYASLYLNEDESKFAKELTEFQHSHPSTIVGSYPVIDEPEYKTQITLKSKEKVNLASGYEELKRFFSSKKWLFKSVEPSFYIPDET